MSPQPRFQEPDNILRGIMLMIFGMFCFSMMSLFAKLQMDLLPVTEVVFFRSAVMALLILPYMLWKKISLFGKNPLLLFVRGCSGFLAVSSVFYATKYLSLASANTLGNTSVFFTAGFSFLLFGEKATTKLVTSILAAFLGVLLVTKPGLTPVSLASLAGLAGGFFGGVLYVSIRKLHQTESFWTIIFAFGMYGALASVLFGGHQFIQPDKQSLIVLLFMGLVGTLGQIGLTYAFKYGPASVISPFLYSQILFALFFDFLIYQKFPDTMSGFGIIILILAGIMISTVNNQSEVVL